MVSSGKVVVMVTVCVCVCDSDCQAAGRETLSGRRHPHIEPPPGDERYTTR